MTSTEFRADTLKLVLTGMAVCTPALAKIAARWEPELFGPGRRAANLIGGWCVDYFNGYGTAPGEQGVQDQFQSWAEAHERESSLTDETDALLSQCLELARRRSDALNADYVADEAAKLINAYRAVDLAAVVKGHVDGGRQDQALEAIAKFNRIELGPGEGVSVFRDSGRLLQAFSQEEGEGLFRYGHGAVAKFYGNHLEREGFIAYMGPEKVGKTFMLVDMAVRATLSRLKVVFFAVGDMGLNAMIRRFAVRVADKPLRPCTALWPMKLVRQTGDKHAAPEHKEQVFEDGLTYAEALESFRRLQKRDIRSDDDYLMLFAYPNSTATVKQLDAVLQDLARQKGFVADVVVIDYADILAAPPGIRDLRDQINANWKAMRALSQARHCLVVTATQTDADSYGKERIGLKNFSDDKRKYGHVTGMIALNQTPEEKKLGVMRLGWTVLREGEFHSDQYVHVAGCLARGRPVIQSCR